MSPPPCDAHLLLMESQVGKSELIAQAAKGREGAVRVSIPIYADDDIIGQAMTR